MASWMVKKSWAEIRKEFFEIYKIKTNFPNGLVKAMYKLWDKMKLMKMLIVTLNATENDPNFWENDPYDPETKHQVKHWIG